MRSATGCRRNTTSATRAEYSNLNVDLRGDRSLTLRYIPHNRAPLDKGRKEVLKHVHRLWGFDVMLEQQNEDGSVELLERCPPRMNGL